MPNPVQKLDREQRRWADLRETLSDWSEEDLLSAMESETDLAECIADLDREILEDETQLAGLDATIVRLEARAIRHKKAIEVKRRVILSAMEKAGLKTLKTPEGTLTVSPGRAAVVIFEQASLPDKYLKPQEPRVDKAQLGKDLRAGEKITGATLSNQPSTLTIRRS